MTFSEQEQLVIRFFDAAKEGDLKTLKECLDKGVSPLAKLPEEFAEDVREKNILQTLIFSLSTPEPKLIDATEMILKKVDDPKAYVQLSQGVLHWAISRDHLKLGGLLIERGAKLDAPDRDGNTALHTAISYENLKAAEMLLSPAYWREKDPKEYVNAANKKGQTALHLAKNEKYTKLLLDKGGDIEKEDKDKWTPLFYSASRNDIQSMELITGQMKTRGLEALKEYVNHLDKNEETALHKTLNSAGDAKKNVAVINHLLASGADPYHRGLLYSFIPAQRIADEGDISSVKLMTEQERPHETEKERANLLNKNFLSAVSGGDTEVMEYLLTQGAEINPKQDEEADFTNFNLSVPNKEFPGLTTESKMFFSGTTALHVAAYKGDTVTMKWLLGKGADATAKDGFGHTPVHFAAGESNYGALETLFAHIEKQQGRDAVKAAANAQDNREQTPLHLFALNNKYRDKESNPITDKDIETMRVLKNARANWLIKDNEGVRAENIWSERVEESQRQEEIKKQQIKDEKRRQFEKKNPRMANTDADFDYREIVAQLDRPLNVTLAKQDNGPNVNSPMVQRHSSNRPFDKSSKNI